MSDTLQNSIIISEIIKRVHVGKGIKSMYDCNQLFVKQKGS